MNSVENAHWKYKLLLLVLGLRQKGECAKYTLTNNPGFHIFFCALTLERLHLHSRAANSLMVWH